VLFSFEKGGQPDPTHRPPGVVSQLAPGGSARRDGRPPRRAQADRANRGFAIQQRWERTLGC
jgi:hypothetical protein